MSERMKDVEIREREKESFQRMKYNTQQPYIRMKRVRKKEREIYLE